MSDAVSDPRMMTAMLQVAAAHKFLDAELLRLEGHGMAGNRQAIEDTRARAHALLDHLMDTRLSTTALFSQIIAEQNARPRT